MNRICLFPGTFDPLTLGHVDIINRALPLFDRIIVGIGLNAAKGPMFTPEQRLQWIQEIYKDEPRVQGAIYDGLTVEYCKKIGSKFILRGIRYVSDFEYEKTIGHMNHAISGIETVFFLTSQEHSAINSSIIREMHQNHADISPFVTSQWILVN